MIAVLATANTTAVKTKDGNSSLPCLNQITLKAPCTFSPANAAKSVTNNEKFTTLEYSVGVRTLVRSGKSRNGTAAVAILAKV